MIDADYPKYMRLIADDRSSLINPNNGYLFEGIFYDIIGIICTKLGLNDLYTELTWWICGNAGLVFVIISGILNKSTNLYSILLIIIFSHLIDTLALWIGKFDPFLFSFLIMSINKNKKIALIGSAFSAFCNPGISILSIVGIIIGSEFPRQCKNYYLFLTSFLCSTLDLFIYHYYFPEMIGNITYFLNNSPHFIQSALNWGFISFICSIVLPMLFIGIYSGYGKTRNHTQKFVTLSWIFSVYLVSCVFTLDHTRIACLLTIAPLMVFLRSRPNLTTDVPRKISREPFSFAFLVLLRLITPHINGNGMALFFWGHSY